MNKQRLEQNQKLNLTAAQIQFLNLLQIPIISLKKRIEEELEKNPALEEEEEEEEEEYPANFSLSSLQKSNDVSKFQIEEKKESLSEYLHQQLTLIDLEEDIRFLVSYLIDSLDDSGFLPRDLHSISSDLLISDDLDISEEQLLSSVSVLQKLEPCGVGARNLKDCLLIQLQNSHPKNKLAKVVVANYYESFVNKNFDYLYKNLSINDLELKEIYSLIESLNPIPSHGFSKDSSQTEYITPDFIITLKNNFPEVYPAKLNTNNVKVSSYYLKLLDETTEEETKTFLKEKIEKAKWFKNALIKRNETLINIMRAIVNFQKKYFTTGDEKDLIPMKLADIAQIVKVDISTISRASNSKYLETNFGTFKVKELFSEAYKKTTGEIISTKEIKLALKTLIENENKSTPFTDEELSELLGEKEYHIARRTVAKYREGMNLPVAKLRKSL